MVAGMAAVYAVSPIDLIPDRLPVVGKVDDVLIVAFALDHLMRGTPPDVVRSHWPGSEDAFVEAWRELAEWTVTNIPGCTFAKLLRDDADGTRFFSFSPWRDESAVASWREHPGFQERVAHIQGFLDSFTPHTMHVAAEAGPPTPDPW